MITIEQSKCIGCEACIKDCVTGNIALQDGKAQYRRTAPRRAADVRWR